MRLPRSLRFIPVLCVLAVASFAALGACGDDGGGPSGPGGDAEVATVEVTPGSATLDAIGATVDLAATPRNVDGDAVQAEVQWSSTATSVATVDGTGVVTARGEGDAVIRATAGDAVGSAAVTVDQAVASVEVSPQDRTLTAIGEFVDFTAEIADANGNAVADASASWSVSDAAIATIDGVTGRARAVGAGETVVTAEAEGVTGTATLTVAPEVAEITVTPAVDSATVIGGTAQFSAEAADANGNPVTGVTFGWSSSDDGVATVDGTGLATAVAPGSAEISAEANGVTGSGIFVVDPEVTAVEVLPDSAGVDALDATVDFDAEATDGAGNVIPGVSFSWTSSDDAVATVDADGVATAVGNGSTTISAEADGVTGSGTFTVAQAVSDMAVTPDSTDVVVGDTARFSAEATDANGNPVEGATISWSSSDDGVATVDDTGLATGVSQGTATITAAADGVTATATLVVNPDVASVVVTPDSAGLDALGATATFSAEARDDQGDPVSGVGFTWTSSNAAVATVDDTGIATAVGNGSTAITAEAAGVTGSATLTVDQAVSTVSVSPDSASVTVGDTTRFTAEADDGNGNPVEGATFTWSSSDDGVATVDDSGLATGQAEGTATITATASGVSADATLTVAAASTIGMVSGDAQNGKTRQEFAEPLVVEVLDGSGDPRQGVTVSWSVTAGDATFSGSGTQSASTTTDAQGRAQVTVTSDTTLTTHTVEASASGVQGSPVTFTAETTVALLFIEDSRFVDFQGRTNDNAAITLAVGDTIEWEYVSDGQTVHTVTSGEGQGGNSGSGVPSGGTAFDSGNMSPGDTFRTVLDAAGLWTYYCKIHPSTMFDATIDVQ